MIRDLADEVEYHVILLEFSLNGLMGVQLLLHRLRRRYPHALFIYIDLYSNRKPGYSNCVGSNCRMTQTRIEGLRALLGKVTNAHLLQLPRPKDPLNWENEVKQWFAHDGHHLNSVGHEWIAQHVVEIIGNHNFVSGPQGDWLEGDLCLSWFKNGQVPPPVQLQGGTLHEFTKFKFAYEIPSYATLDINTSSLKGTSPLLLVYMTKGDMYPRVSLNFNNEHFWELDSKSDPKFVENHVTAVRSLGFVVPSPDLHIEIKTINYSSKKKWPFRLVGIVMCAACRTFDPHFAEKDCHQRACFDFVEE